MTAHFAGSSHPEWGYLAPGPSFVRTARIALVACAVGATAGAGVVASLIDRPPEGSVAARTLVRQIEAPAPTPASQPQRAVPAAAPASGENGRAQSAQAGAGAKSLLDSQSDGASAARAPAEIAAVAAPVAEATTSATTTSPTTLGKKTKPKRSFSHNRWRGGPPDDYALGGTSRWAADEADRTGYYGPQQAWGGLR